MGRKLTSREIGAIARLVTDGKNDTEIAIELGIPRTTVRDSRRRAEMKPRAEDKEDAHVYLQPPVLKIQTRKHKALIEQPGRTTVIWGDVHFPFEDEASVTILYKLLELLRVDRVVDLGDAIDNWQISTFLPPDERRLTEQQRDFSAQFKAVAGHLGIVTSLTPDADRIFLEGNHEERWDRMLRQAQQDARWRHVLGLPQVQQAMELRRLMGIDQAGWVYKDSRDNEYLLNKHLLATHGIYAGKWAVRQILEKYGKSVIFGHTHRIGNWTKRDLKATEASWMIGCLCDLNPHYGDSMAVDWANGFAVLLETEDLDHWALIQLRIHWGRCMTPWGELRG
jgi:DNA-binding CsgD family transcriptional regulator